MGATAPRPPSGVRVLMTRRRANAVKEGSPMSNEVEEVFARLGWLHFWARHCCAQADAKMGEVNRLIGQLAGAGFVQEAVFLGEVIHPHYYPPAAHEQGPVQVAQA